MTVLSPKADAEDQAGRREQVMKCTCLCDWQIGRGFGRTWVMEEGPPYSY